MIVAEQKPLDEINRMIAPYEKVLILGCGTCMTVCNAGGEREASFLHHALQVAQARSEDEKHVFSEYTVKRQCDPEFFDTILGRIEDANAVLSLGCGAGVQAIAERYPNKPVYAGLNTSFLGILEERGVWAEKCAACGSCVLHLSGGICPITRCAKRLLNGPCGGSHEDRCEVRPDRPCAWQLIYKRLKDINQLDKLDVIAAPKNWNPSLSGGPRVVIREDHRI